MFTTTTIATTFAIAISAIGTGIVASVAGCRSWLGLRASVAGSVRQVSVGVWQQVQLGLAHLLGHEMLLPELAKRKACGDFNPSRYSASA